MRTLIAIVAMLLGCSAWSQPIQRQFFTTNTNPRVVVAAGTNVTVQYTTTGTDIRTYTVNSSGGGGTQTNISYLAVTNAPWQWGTQNGTNWAQIDTNILSTLFTNSVVAAGTNIIVGTNGLVYTVSVDMGFTNYLATTNYSVTAATNAAYNSTNGFPWTNIYSPGISGGATNQVYTQVGWSGYPQVTNLSLWTNAIGTAIVPTLWLTNPTPAALGAQQNSPAFMMTGQGWRSGNSTTMPLSMGFYVQPQQGSSSNPSGRMYIVTSISNAVPTGGIYFDTSGNALGISTVGNINGLNTSVGSPTLSSSAGDWVTIAPQQRGTGNNRGLLVNSYIGNNTANMTGSNAIVAILPVYNQGTGSTGAAMDLFISRTETLLSSGSQYFIYCEAGGVKKFTVDTTGSLVASNVTATASLISSNGLYVYGSNSVHEVDALGTAIYPALWLTNSTAAALGAQQASPALMLGGQGWRSGNSTTMPVQMGMYVLPVQGSSANPRGQLLVASSVSGSALAATGSGFDSNGDVISGTAFLAGTYLRSGASSYFTWSGRSQMYSPADQDIRLTDSTGLLFNRLYFGAANALWPALKIESTNAPAISIRTGADANYASLVASNVTASASVTATNGYVHQLYATNGYTVCTASKEIYMVNSTTNPLFVLPDASTVTGKRFMFTTTNVGSFFIVTNATGTQTIANGQYLSYTNDNNGQKVTSFISDGAHWWLTSKGKTVLPSASWSCNTNTTFANVTNMITLDTTEANNGVGIALDNSAWFTAGVGSKIWVTNAGMYLITFSAVWSKTGGGSANGDIWIRQDGVTIPRTMTLQTVQNATSTNVMTVNFILPVTKTTYFDLVGASPDGTAQLQAMPAITSPFARPACPSIIVTIQKTSD